jgi:hypothetical protein
MRLYANQKAFEIKPGAYALNNWIVLQTVVEIINRTPLKQVAFGSKSKEEMIAEVENQKKEPVLLIQ